MRLINLALIIVAVVGLVFYFSQLPELLALKREEERLLNLAGNMQVTKDKKFHLLAIDTGHKSAFAWRMHCQDGSEYAFFSQGVHRKLKPWNNLKNPYIQRGWPDQEKRIYTSFSFEQNLLRECEGGSEWYSEQSPKLNAFFNQHWDELEIETGVGKETVATDLTQAITLVSIKVPSHLYNELDELNIKGTDRYKKDDFYRLIIGPPELASDVNGDKKDE